MFSKYKDLEFDQQCHHCEEEVILKGYKKQPCPKCKELLLPCSLCDAYLDIDDDKKVFAKSCEYCIFSTNTSEQNKCREATKDTACSTFTNRIFILTESNEDVKPKVIPWSLKEINKELKRAELHITQMDIEYRERSIRMNDGRVCVYKDGEDLVSITLNVDAYGIDSDKLENHTLGPYNINKDGLSDFTDYVLDNPGYIPYDILNRRYDNIIYDLDRLTNSYIEDLCVDDSRIVVDYHEDIIHTEELLEKAFAAININMVSLQTWGYNEKLEDLMSIYTHIFCNYVDIAWDNFLLSLSSYLQENNYDKKVIMCSRDRKELYMFKRIYEIDDKLYLNEYYGVAHSYSYERDAIIENTILLAEISYRDAMLDFLYILFDEYNYLTKYEYDELSAYVIDGSNNEFKKQPENKLAKDAIISIMSKTPKSIIDLKELVAVI